MTPVLMWLLILWGAILGSLLCIVVLDRIERRQRRAEDPFELWERELGPYDYERDGAF